MKFVRVFRVRWMVLGAALLLASCQQAGDLYINSKVFFAWGEYLGEFNLRDGSSTIVGHLGDVTIQRVSEFRGEQLLVSLIAYGRAVETQLVVSVTPDTGGRQIIGEGESAVYLPGSDSIIYSTASALVANPRRGGGRKLQLISTLLGMRLVKIMVLDADRILFEVEQQQMRRTYLYDHRLDTPPQLTTLSKICRMHDSAPVHGAIACRLRDNDKRYAIVSPEGRVLRHLELPFSSSARILGPCDNTRLVIFWESRRPIFRSRPRHAVWVYNLDTSAATRVSRNQYLGTSIVCR